jgi:hypothetical protein
LLYQVKNGLLHHLEFGGSLARSDREWKAQRPGGAESSILVIKSSTWSGTESGSSARVLAMSSGGCHPGGGFKPAKQSQNEKLVPFWRFSSRSSRVRMLLICNSPKKGDALFQKSPTGAVSLNVMTPVEATW